VGPGGVLLEPQESVDDWIAVLRNLWGDPGRYERLAAQALAHSRRPELLVDRVMHLFEGVLASAIEQHPAHVSLT
jgi:hypothetical protein